MSRIREVPIADKGIQDRRSRIQRKRPLPAAQARNMGCSITGRRVALNVRAFDVEAPRSNIRRGGIAEPRLLAFGKPDLHFGRERQRNLVLDGKDIFEAAIEPFRPDMDARRGVDQLRRYPYSVDTLANAAFEHVANAKLPGDLAAHRLRDPCRRSSIDGR